MRMQRMENRSRGRRRRRAHATPDVGEAAMQASAQRRASVIDRIQPPTAVVLDAIRSERIRARSAERRASPGSGAPRKLFSVIEG